MRLTLCDGCRKDLKAERYDRVELRGRRLDLCRECFPRYQEFEKAVEDLAKKNEDSLNLELHNLTEKFWEGIIGSKETTDPEKSNSGVESP